MLEADGKRSAAIDREIDVLRRYFALRKADPALAPVYNHGVPDFYYRVAGRIITLGQLARQVDKLERAARRAEWIASLRTAAQARKAVV